MTASTPVEPDPRARGASIGRLEAMLSAALEAREAGRADWLDEACKHHPELKSQVRALVERAQSLPDILGDGTAFDPLLGRHLGGRFLVMERIGAGSMGVVYVAEDRELSRRVACKVVRHGLMSPALALERFEREARSMAAVQHPGVATIHDRGRTDDDQVYLVMELIDGAPLSKVLEFAALGSDHTQGDENKWIQEHFGIARRSESSWLRTVVRWTADLANGLEAVHGAGVLHRDIKPSNIHVRRDGRPALLDFGIARLDESSSITRTPTTLGSPAYMAPEALDRAVERTKASDVYSLTATLYHMLTLRAPYEGSPTQVLTALATREPVPAAQLRPGLPRDLQAILDKGMHRRPLARYASAAALEEDLRAFLEFRPVAARPVSRFERVSRRWMRSRAVQGALVALILLTLITGTVVGARAWREHAAEVRRVQHADLWRHVPPNFSVVGVSNRVSPHQADIAALRNLLDQVCETASEPLPTRLLRASFRQDHGDPAGAAQDMAAVAQFVGTPFARELAARYAAVRTESVDPRAVNLDGLPEPQTATDRYLLAYHKLRLEDPASALQLLSDPEVRKIPHAEELFLASTNFDGLIRVEQQRLALDRYTDLVRLEGRLGMRTAATALIASRMLWLQGRFDEAVRIGAEGLALAPRSHVLCINAGYSALAQHQLGEARRYLELGRELRPTYAKIVQDLLWVEIADRRFDAAERLVRESEPVLVPHNATWGDYWSAVVATHAALDARERGDSTACAASVARATDAFARVPKRTHDKEGKPTDASYRIATALASKDEQALVLALARLVEEKPEHWWRQDLLATHMPRDLSPEATQAVRGVIKAWSTRTDPKSIK